MICFSVFFCSVHFILLNLLHPSSISSSREMLALLVCCFDVIIENGTMNDKYSLLRYMFV